MQRTDIFDLERLSLSAGEGRRIDTLVRSEPLEYAGERYAMGERDVAVRLDVSRTMGGYALRLRCSVRLSGPCMRCLEAAEQAIQIDVREVDERGAGDELRSPYLHEGELDLHSWTRDALALALPAQILCAEGCLGLCPDCGANLNEAGREHRHERGPDPRWAKLSELRFD